MANKTITELQIVDAVTDDLSVPSDNGIQSYRFTIAQLVAYILANNSITQAMLQDGIVDTAELKDSFIHGLTGVTPVAGDYVPLADASDSNNKKKASVASLRNAVYRSVTTTDSVGADDETMKLSGASFTSTLPTAVGIEGKRYKFLHQGTSLTQVYTLATTSSQTIGGVAGGSYKLCTNGELLEIESDGANWIIINHYAKTGWVDSGVVTWDATTTAPTKATGINVDRLLWRRDGCDLFGRIEYSQSNTTSAAAGSGDYKIKLVPTGALIDTTKITPYTTTEGAGVFQNRNIVGVGAISVSAAGGHANLNVFDTSYGRIIWVDANNAGYATSGDYHLASAAFNFCAEFRVPITDWQP